MARGVVAAEVEALPEADRLEGFAHPRDTIRLIGHAQPEAEIADALGSGRMHHAWLLSGPAGIGKATFAYRVARAALARADERDMFGGALDVDAGSQAARQVASLSHPGLLVIRRAWDQKAKRFAASIAVDDVRRLKSFLALSAEEGSRRVVIVDSAEEMNANAANALLKSLEEPPPRTIFLIVTSTPGRLLPTIRSRTRTLALQPLAEPELVRAVRQAMDAVGKTAPADLDWQKLAVASSGSVRRALALIENGGLALQGRIDAILEGLPRLDTRAVHALGDELQGAAQEQKYQLFFELLDETLARLIRSAARKEGAARDLALAEKLIGGGRLATFAELWETLGREKADVQSLNLDRRALIVASFARLEAASRS